MLQIGPYSLDSLVVLAPMAGVTDLPFRRLCRHLGAGLVVSEMVTSDTTLWSSRKSQLRLNHDNEIEPRSVQIAGGDPSMMATAARLNVEHGAQIIDINMGCPAKKVCKKAAGSALMKDERLVAEILQAVVGAVDVPVTLKIRTGWAIDQRNGLAIAKIAEDGGIQALAVHGRTKACAFKGDAEYDTIAEIKSALSIPIIANGDIDSPQKAQAVMAYTAADAVMVGRAAQGRPWICREIDHFLRHGDIVAPPKIGEVKSLLIEHLNALYAFYGEFMGPKIARKHVAWYLKASINNEAPNTGENTAAKNIGIDCFRRSFNRLEEAPQQLQAIAELFDQLPTHQGKWPHKWRPRKKPSRGNSSMKNIDTLPSSATTSIADSVSEGDQQKQHLSNAPVAQAQTLRDSVSVALNNYFAHLEGQDVTDVYEMVLSEVEAPLLEEVMKYTRNNQTRASTLLGLNRGTLRKKLKQYGLL